VVGRNTQGVRIIRLGNEEKVIGVDRIEGLAGEDGEDDDEPDNDLANDEENQSGDE
jgi:DNA gyrase subunit A